MSPRRWAVIRDRRKASPWVELARLGAALFCTVTWATLLAVVYRVFIR